MTLQFNMTKAYGLELITSLRLQTPNWGYHYQAGSLLMYVCNVDSGWFLICFMCFVLNECRYSKHVVLLL